MGKKMCGLFVVPLLVVCLLSSCEPKPEPKPEPNPAVASVTFDPPLDPPDLVQRGNCLEVTGLGNDSKPYRSCYYPYSRKDVGAGPNRFRCSTDVANCSESPKGECSKEPAKQKEC